MRKIEQQMLDAVKNKQDFKLQNTRVEVIDFPGIESRVNVYLHDNLIFTLFDDKITLSHCGWRTNTTKSRLNALLCEFSDGCYLQQVKGDWYLIQDYKRRMINSSDELTLPRGIYVLPEVLTPCIEY